MKENNPVLIHYGEIALKGKNRGYFTGQLKNNIKSKLESTDIKAKVEQRHGYFLIYGVNPNKQDLLKQISGIVWYAPASVIKKTDKIEDSLVELAQEKFEDGKTFRVEVKRADKKFPKTSIELERDLGAVILKNTKWNKVKLKNPDQTFYIDISQNQIFIYSQKIKGIGGLPVGTAGKALVLLSGGIDSPVAAYLMAKRGCRVDFLHFAASLPQQLDADKYKVSQLAQTISSYSVDSKLFVVPYTYFRSALVNKKADYELILFRRFMVRLAEKLAQKNKSQALVTGDNLSQVASQTMENLATVSAAASLPILRPLLTYDKIEIINLAKQIGTYNLSIEPYQDCCALVSQNAKTKSTYSKMEYLEQKLFPDYNELTNQTLDEIKIIKYKNGDIA